MTTRRPRSSPRPPGPRPATGRPGSPRWVIYRLGVQPGELAELCGVARNTAARYLDRSTPPWLYALLAAWQRHPELLEDHRRLMGTQRLRSADTDVAP